MNTIENLPPVADLVRLVASLKPEPGFWLTKHDEPVSDEIFPTEDAARDALESDGCEATDFAPVFLQLTVGWSPETGAWSYQTGDNSYSGGAYGHPVWAVAYLTHELDPSAVAEALLNELANQTL